MSRFTRQAQRIESEWLRGLRAAASDRLSSKAPLAASAHSPISRVQDAMRASRRKSGGVASVAASAKATIAKVSPPGARIS